MKKVATPSTRGREVDYTLCFLLRDNRVLLKVSTDGISNGKIIGPGGSLRPGETSVDCVIREVKEETGYVLSTFFYHGIKYASYDRPDRRFDTVHIFSSSEFEGELKNSRTSCGIFKWMDVKRLPIHRMWADNAKWIGFVLEGRRFPTDYAFFYDSKKEVLLRSAPVSNREAARFACGIKTA